MASVPASEVLYATVSAMAPMAGFGPVTSTIEGVATSVAAGILLGGFGAGVLGVAVGSERRRRDEPAVVTSYAGGVVTVVAILVEAIVR